MQVIAFLLPGPSEARTSQWGGSPAVAISAESSRRDFAPRDAGGRVPRLCDLAVRWGLVLLIGSTPMAFGAVQPWAYRTMAAVVLALLAAWSFKMAWAGELRVARLACLAPLLVFAAVVSFQLIPLPAAALPGLSPAAHELYGWTIPRYPGMGEAAGGLWGGFGRPLSVYPHATKQEIAKILSYIGVFLLVVNNVRTRRDVRFLLGALVFAGFAFSLLAIAQKLTWNGMAFWFIRLSPGRDPFGPYINRNHFAGYVGMIIPLAMGLLLSRRLELGMGGGARRFRFRLAEWGESGRSRLALLLFMIAVMAAALLMSLSRGGMVGALLSVATVLVLLALRWREKHWGFMIFAAAVLAFFIIAWVGYDQHVAERVGTLLSREKMMGSMRLRIWRDALPIFADYPLFGTGLGTFGVIFPLYKTLPFQAHFLYPENDYLQLLIETGLAGAAAILSAVAFFVVHVAGRFFQLRDMRMIALAAGGMGAGAATAFHAMVDFSLHIPANAFHFALIMGLLVAMVNLRGGEREQRLTLSFARLPLPGRFRHLGYVLPLAALLAAALIPAPRAADAARFENGERAFTQTLIANFQGDPARTRALGQEAVREFLAAISINPLNAAYHYHLGWAAAFINRMGGPPPGDRGIGVPGHEEIFRKALRLYPTNAKLHHAVAMNYLLNWASLSPAERAFGSDAFRRAVSLHESPYERADLKARTKESLLRLKGKDLEPAVLALVEGT